MDAFQFLPVRPSGAGMFGTSFRVDSDTGVHTKGTSFYKFSGELGGIPRPWREYTLYSYSQ